MLISHEVPTCLLPISCAFNDYDYSLLHLLLEHGEYYDYYKNTYNRQQILDNSLFELGDALSGDVLAAMVEDIKPTFYIVPDCLNNKDITIERFDKFEKLYKNLPGKSIGVVQGSNYAEMDECYRYMKKHAEKIAIPFDSKAFGDTLEEWCYGRPLYVKHLVETGLWDERKYHHLLGCSYAKEFISPVYRYVSIHSVDTSNPVVAGIKGLTYSYDGLDEKPSIKLCELIDHKVTAEEYQRIIYNTQRFREICNV